MQPATPSSLYHPAPNTGGPTTPPVHLLHATTGWNWTHPNTAGGPVSDPVPYTTGHPLQEPGWPKIVPLDDSGQYSSAYVQEVTGPERLWRQPVLSCALPIPGGFKWTPLESTGIHWNI